MKTLIGGAIAVILGLIGIWRWHIEFLEVIAGVLPIMLLLGGALALYLGFDELKDNWKKDSSSEDVPANDDAEKYKQEIEDLKKEIDTLKSEKA